jgi:hypothetical protein
MNGRTYDPRVGQFLSPDPLVTSPFMSAAFNRYSYVLNNPLRFVDPSGFQPCDASSCGSGGAGGFGIRLPVSQGSEGAGNTSLSAATFAPTFAAGVTSQNDGAGGTTGLEAEATFGERALYLGAGVGVGAGTGYVIGKGVLLLCTATGVCTAGVVAVVVVGATAYAVHELFFDGGADRIASAFTEFKTKEDAFIVGETIGGVAIGAVGVAGAWKFSAAARGGPGPVLQGAAGVERAILDLEASGGRVLGREITLEAGGVRTRPDLFVELPSGQQAFLEIKTGAFASLTPNQMAAFPQIWAEGAIPRGANAAAAGLIPGVPIGPTPVWTVYYLWPLP